MKYLLAAAALLAIIFAGGAITSHAFGAGPNGDPVLPPARYDHLYTDGELIVIQVESMEEMARACYPAPNAYRLVGCQFFQKFDCLIFIAPDSYIKRFARYGITFDTVFRHERAHCVGWPRDHPP